MPTAGLEPALQRKQILSLPRLPISPSGRINGAGREIRTPHLMITNQLLYQMSYTGIILHTNLRNQYRHHPLTIHHLEMHYRIVCNSLHWASTA